MAIDRKTFEQMTGKKPGARTFQIIQIVHNNVGGTDEDFCLRYLDYQDTVMDAVLQTLEDSYEKALDAIVEEETLGVRCVQERDAAIKACKEAKERLAEVEKSKAEQSDAQARYDALWAQLTVAENRLADLEKVRAERDDAHREIESLKAVNKALGQRVTDAVEREETVYQAYARTRQAFMDQLRRAEALEHFLDGLGIDYTSALEEAYCYD